jgi:Mannosyl-glycoprotein endo-beta-N-acetylglucosaminidase
VVLPRALRRIGRDRFLRIARPLGLGAALAAAFCAGVAAASMRRPVEPARLRSIVKVPDATLASASEPDPAVLKRPTPMQPEQAAHELARAWRAVFGEPAPPGAVAVLWAQWALETGRGRWMVDFNFAGVKGKAPSGGSALCWTSEGSDDAAHRERDRFRAYRNAQAGARDYIALLARRYPGALERARDGDAEGFVQALARGGYFTAEPEAYLRALSSLSRQYLSGDLDGLPPS